MSFLPAWLTSRMPGSFSRSANSNPADSPGNDEDRPGSGPFYPSLEDVSVVRGLLLRPLWRKHHRPSQGFPPEIVDMILDEAEYWPSVFIEMDAEEQIIAQDRDRVLLMTPPLCFDMKSLMRGDSDCFFHRTQRPCRKIIFDISAHDQGFGNGVPDSFEQAWTWFDVEAVPNADKTILQTGQFPTLPRVIDMGGPNRLQTVRCQRPGPGRRVRAEDYQVVWRYTDCIAPDSAEAERIRREQGRGEATLDGSFVRSLAVGDSVAVWGRARFGAWRLHVKYLSARVFWAA